MSISIEMTLARVYDRKMSILIKSLAFDHYKRLGSNRQCRLLKNRGCFQPNF
jgi:hypothetical protein